jgi:hypothetical protein
MNDACKVKNVVAVRVHKTQNYETELPQNVLAHNLYKHDSYTHITMSSFLCTPAPPPPLHQVKILIIFWE